MCSFTIMTRLMLKQYAVQCPCYLLGIIFFTDFFIFFTNNSWLQRKIIKSEKVLSYVVCSCRHYPWRHGSNGRGGVGGVRDESSIIMQQKNRYV